jgi:hypothetical protein
MKKVLCGLVIALMMTGNGYAYLTDEMCGYLKKESLYNVASAIALNLAAQKQADKNKNLDINDTSFLDKLGKYEKELLEEAHYQVSIHSKLCD